MEATVEQATSSARPQNIVEQLLEIAQKHDAMDVIGGSTSWRWQEGLITRMPKTKTVAAILTKAFKTESPVTWIARTSGELQSYLMNIYSLESMENILLEDVEDFYETLFLVTISDGVGATHDQLVFKFALYKYAEVFAEESYFEDLDEDYVLKMNSKWAEKKLSKCLSKFYYRKNELGFYFLDTKVAYSGSEKFAIHIRKIEMLRLKIVGYNSHYDMWRGKFASLTDSEMIEMEYKMLDYWESLMKDFSSRKGVPLLDEETRKNRVFSITAITNPNRPGEKLRCDC